MVTSVCWADLSSPHIGFKQLLTGPFATDKQGVSDLDAKQKGVERKQGETTAMHKSQAKIRVF